MLKRILTYLLAGAALLSFYGCPTNWSENYRYDKQEPYDIYALHQLLDARPEGLTMVADSLGTLREYEGNHANYLFVGRYAYYNERGITHLLDFVERGNTAFIAANDLPEDLASHLFGDDCYYNIYDTDQIMPYLQADTVQLQLTDNGQNFELIQVYDHEPYNRATHYVNEELLCDPNIDNEVIGTLDTVLINFVRLSWGEGDFFFLTNPIFLTNYFITDSLRYEYAEASLAVLGEGPVYWDEYSRVPPSVARQRDNRRNRGNNNGYNGGRNLLTGNEALSYIQEQAPLALAWYTLIVAALLFVLFRGKRRQRIIPSINRRENSSKRFIDTISRLVYQKGNHAAIARQELGNLRFHLQDKYGIHWKEGQPPPENLAELTGISPEVAEKALIEIRVVQGKIEIEELALMRFYRAIEPLYKL